MKIGVAQIRPVKGDIVQNIIGHQRMIEAAVEAGANALFFPELSITGYEPALAKALAIGDKADWFDIFVDLSNDHELTIGVGVPTRSSNDIKISMVIFQPRHAPVVYSKQQLHADEKPFFVEGDHQVYVPLGNEILSPGICYESLQAGHAAAVHEGGASMYIASVAKSANGVAKAMAHYPEVARGCSIPVLMSNCVGFCDNFESVGQSAAWNAIGELLGQLDATSEGFVLYDTELATAEVVRV